jgi:hypothetical protein
MLFANFFATTIFFNIYYPIYEKDFFPLLNPNAVGSIVTGADSGSTSKN